jgi:light-regulated signal transduction histidine kinase (bacteriophytochrome)
MPGSVQPHGALLAIEPQNFRIVQAGGDTIRILGAEPADLVKGRLTEWLAPGGILRLQTLLDAEGPLIRPVHAFTLASKQDQDPIDAYIYRSGDLAVVELEPAGEPPPEDALTLLQKMLARLQQAAAPHEFCQSLANEVRRVSGFDRIVIYRFLADGSRIVEAEARNDEVESLLGMHPPPSGIAQGARDLHPTDWVRLIPNARSIPAPILPAEDPGAGRSLDLSHSLIRSVSPKYLKHLENMGIAASMSLSIAVAGRLWGLIACHHRTPRFLCYRWRVIWEVFAQMASAKLETKVEAVEFESRLKSMRIPEELVTRMSGEDPMDCIDADGAGPRLDIVSQKREEARRREEALSAELDRREAQWQTVAAELKEAEKRRELVESELSQVLRSTVEDQEAERRRIARELHDSLGQTLTALQLGLDELARAAPSNEAVRDRVAGLKALAKDAGAEVNRLAWEIRPAALDDLGLETAIRHLAETWSERLNLRFDLRLALHDRRLPPAVETTLYRALQEAIANVARHAQATRVAILLEAGEKEVRMIVEDNGRGFAAEQAAAPTRRLGLLGVRERLSLVAGALEVESAPGRGCTLYIRAPL